LEKNGVTLDNYWLRLGSLWQRFGASWTYKKRLNRHFKAKKSIYALKKERQKKHMQNRKSIAADKTPMAFFIVRLCGQRRRPA
jgi:hypothetical protein